MRKNRGGNKGRLNKPLRSQERNYITEGVYNNNYFMHAATSHVGAVVQVETVQGGVFEGVFKTFSSEFDVVLEVAHKVDPEDPQKLNAHEVIDNLIFHTKDIVNMCAANVEADYAYNTALSAGSSFLTDTNISKCNGEITGEKDLQPWEDPMSNGADECELDTSDTGGLQNGGIGWDVNDMFQANEKFGVQTTYDDSLSDYTCQINRKDTKDFKEDEAKAARIAMEIERNPSSQSRLMLENGDNEEELYAAVTRPDSDGSKYVPPARRSNNQPHRAGSGNTRMSYPPNGNGGRPPKSNNAAQPRYVQQQQQQYHASPYGAHPPMGRDNGSRASSDNKNSQLSSSQSSNMSAYPPANVHGQQRSYPPNNASMANHSQPNAPLPQSKSQRTSPISQNALPNGNTDYQPKSLPPVSHSPPHLYHNQNQPQNAGGNNVLNAQHQQRKHQPHHHHQNNSRVREEQINDLKKFGSDFNLSYDSKHKDAGDGPKPIQVVTNRNKSPPGPPLPSANTLPERNVVPVTIVSTLPPSNKFTTSGPLTTPPQSALGTSTTAGAVPPVPTTQVGHKPHQMVMPPAQYQQAIQLQQRGDSPMLLQHQAPPMTSTAPPHAVHHSQSMQPPPPQQGMMQQKPAPQHKVHMHPQGVPPPQGPVQMQQHPAASPQQANTVIPVPNASLAAVAGSVPPPQQQQQPGGVSPPQAAGLPLNAHQRPPLQQQPPPLKSQTPSTVSTPSASPPVIEGASESNSAKGKDGDVAVDDVSQRVKNVRLNPDAKEYIPAVKSFTPISRSPSTPTQSRPHSPHTPSSYIHPGGAPVAAGIQMMLPTAYVVAASPGHVPPPQAQNRLRKTPVNSHRTNEYHASNIPVSAVTGQPLLAPPLPLSQSHIGHGISVPYAHYPQLLTSHHSPVQMIRMVHQPGGMVPTLVPNTIGYHEPGSNATVYVNQNNSAAVAMAQHTQHVHHPQQHPPPSTAPSPSQTPQGPSQSHTPNNNYQHPPLTAQNANHYGAPIMCPVITQQAHGPPHMVTAQQAQQHATLQQYMSQHPSVTPPHILSVIPHSCS